MSWREIAYALIETRFVTRSRLVFAIHLDTSVMASAFVVTNPTDEPITSGLPVICPECETSQSES